MKDLLKKLAEQDKKGETPPEVSSKFQFTADTDQVYTSVNMDDWEEREKNDIYTEMAQVADMEVYEGHVESAYDKNVVSDTDHCPLCHSKTELQYANFIYATDAGTRSMFAPAGYFCTGCPCVIVDQSIIKGGITIKGLKYRGVLGIDYGEKKSPDYLTKWNGKDAVYVFDENRMPVGITTLDETSKYAMKISDHTRPRKKTRKKRHMARRSRRKNRKS